MDALADRGTVFENAISCAPLTGASHASLMTGAYQTRHGIAGNQGKIPSRLVTLAQACRGAGYQTAAIVSNPVLSRRNLPGIDRGFDRYDADFPAMERNRDTPYRDATDTTAATLDWFKAVPRSPFFLWLHYQEPHGPYEVPDRSLLTKVGSLAPQSGEASTLPLLRGNFGQGGIPRYQVLGSTRDPAHYRAQYAARIAYVDGHVGRVLEEVRRLGLEEDTVVVLTSDHGELLGEHDYYFQHGITVLQPVLHVPLILAGPGIDVGGRVPALVSNTDIMPTLLDLLDIGSEDLGEQMDGHTLVPRLQGTPEGEGHYVYAMCERTREWCLLKGRHKFTLGERTPENAERLIDIEEDPAEERDVSAEYPEVAERLKAALLRFRSASPDVLSAGEPRTSRLTDADRRRLRALGYLD